jgi:small subunit ribosomal protein S2
LQSTSERVGIRELLEAGVHFGHQAKRWNPKMKRYIFAQRAGVHIIDLDQTLTLLDKALAFVRGVAEANREVLFVGTKKQAQIPLAEQALRSGQPFVAERYIGGMLTNFQTILPRIQYFKDLAVRVDETPEEERSGKDWFALNREYQKLRRNFAGITEMERLPGAVFVIDPKREELLVKEANRLKIPVLALTDTNCDPEVIDYVIPGNDDAIRAISLISRLVADAIIEGRGEEAPAEERPVPPVIEDAQANAEIQQSATANGRTEAPTAAAEEAPAEEPVAEAGEAQTPAEPETAATQDIPAEPEADAETETTVKPEAVADPAPESEAAEPEAEPEASAESEDTDEFEDTEDSEAATHPEAEPEEDAADEADAGPEAATEVEVEAVEPDAADPEAAEPEADSEPEAETSDAEEEPEPEVTEADAEPEAEEAPDDENEDTEEK